MADHIRFELIGHKPKTHIYAVVSAHDGTKLGEVKWYAQWRGYCFFPTTKLETVWSEDCVCCLQEFLINSNIQHKKDGGR